MMRLVLVHGINNENKSSQRIIDDWLAALDAVLGPQEMAAVRGAEIVAPYYGDVLYEHTSSQVTAGPQAVLMGPGAIATSGEQPSQEEAGFYREALRDLALASGVTEDDIRAQSATTEPIEQSLPNDRRFLAILRALEAVAPLKGKAFLRLLPQAFTYLYRASATKAVNDVVRPALAGDKTVVVSHSLGTIVTFTLLRDDPALTTLVIPSYFTLGSPLAVKAIKNRIGPRFERPGNVRQWINGVDRDDLVTIGRPLNDATFGSGIVNVDDIENGEQAHDIAMYLRDRRIAQAIARSLGA